MRIQGSHMLAAPRERVWETLQDPRALAATLPGCRRLEETGPGEYTATVVAGIGTIKGVYAGRVSLSDQRPPEGYTLRANGQGGPGTIDATVQVTLHEDGGETTRVDYDADAVVGGAIAGVGQRVLAGVAKRNAAEFFTAVDRWMSAPEATAPVPAAAPGRVFERPQAPALGTDPRALVVAALTGALVALLGVLVGRRTAR